MDRGLIKLVTGLLATAAVGVRIQTALKNYKKGHISKKIASTRWPALYKKHNNTKK